MTAKISKEAFSNFSELSIKSPWVISKADQFFELYDTYCSNNAGRKLIVELLEKFSYLDYSSFSKKIHCLVEDIVTTPNIFDYDTMIVSMTGDSNSDSGQFVLYYMKPILEKFNWRKHKTVNTFGKSYDAYKKLKPLGIVKNLILIDEFIGTGNSALGRYLELEKVFTDKGIPLKIFIKSIVATKEGIDFLSKKGIDVTSQMVIYKGITGSSIKKIDKKKIKTMYKLEEKLSKKYEGRLMPRFGYGRSESLYSREDGNTPNNVFPIFWWCYLENNSHRETMFIRAMGDA